LAILYDKPYLIVEADRTASRDPRFKGDSCPALDASSVIFKPNTPYFLQTLATLAQTDLSVLYSESQGKWLRFQFPEASKMVLTPNLTLTEHTARLLNDLGRQETLRGLSLPRMENLNSKQDGILKFLQRIPEINPAVSLLMASQFKSLREILCRFEAQRILYTFNAYFPDGVTLCYAHTLPRPFHIQLLPRSLSIADSEFFQ
jgi:hypothetical protein